VSRSRSVAVSDSGDDDGGRSVSAKSERVKQREWLEQ
jgi:hypothetical protein